MEVTNSEMMMKEEAKKQISHDRGGTSNISANPYNSYITSDRVISSHHSGISYLNSTFLPATLCPMSHFIILS